MRFPEIAVYHAGELVGEVAGYTDLDFSFKWSGVETAQFSVPGVPAFLSAFDAPETVWLDVVINDVMPWTGHITEIKIRFSREKGYITDFDCEGAKAVLDNLLVYPDPGSPVEIQSAAESFKLTGIADDVAGTVIRDAAQRQGVPVEFFPGSSEAGGTTNISVAARMAGVGKTLEDALGAVGLGLRARYWYPGIGLPDFTKGPGVVIVDVVEPATNDVVMWGEADLLDGGVTITPSSSSSLVVGGPGQGVERQYVLLDDYATGSTMTPWGGLQAYVDAPPAQGQEFVPQDDSRVVNARAAARGGVVADMTVEDGSPFEFGRDYLLGDVVTAEVAGIRTRAQITEITVSVSPDSGRKVTPRIGDKKATSPLAALVGVVADLARDKNERERAV